MSSTVSIKTACLFYGASLALLPACGADIGGESADPGVSEEVRSVQQAYLEETCFTQATANMVISANANGIPTPLGTAVVAVSPNESYGQAACPNQWVVDVWDIRGKRFQPIGAGLGSPGAPAGWCEQFWSTSRAMGYYPPLPCGNNRVCPGGWTDLGTWTSVGQRRFGPNLEEACIEWPLNDAFPRVQPSNHPFWFVRTVTVAKWGGSGGWNQRASAGIMANPNY